MLAWEVERREAEMAKKPVIIAGVTNVSPTLKAGAALSKFPTLRGYLIDTRYEGGDEPRQQSYLIIRPSPVAWSVVLKDPSTGLQLRGSAEQYDLLFGVLEALLTSPDCPWEVDPYAQPVGARKKKR